MTTIGEALYRMFKLDEDGRKVVRITVDARVNYPAVVRVTFLEPDYTPTTERFELPS